MDNYRDTTSRIKHFLNNHIVLIILITTIFFTVLIYGSNQFASNNTLTLEDDVIPASGSVNYPILETEKNYVIHANYPYEDIRRYGAIDDGKTDCTKFIQNAVNCNDKIYVPSGTYIISSPIILSDNKELYGNGKSSKISNISPGSEKRIVIVCGFVGGGGSKNSPNAADRTEITKYEIGSNKITIDSKRNHGYSVGDVVGIFGDTSGAHNPKYQQLDMITSVSGDELTLKSGIKLTEFENEDIVSIVNISNFKAPLDIPIPLKETYIAKNCYVHDIFLEQAVDHVSSGHYVIFTSCFECSFENIHFYGSTPVGSNMSGFTTFKNCTAEYHGGPSDNCEFQYMNVFDGLSYTRVDALVNKDVGFTINNGAYNTIKNCYFDFGGTGSSISCVQGLYTTIQNNTLINGNCYGSGNIRGCYHGTTVITNNAIYCHENQHAMNIYGKNNTVRDNQIYNLDLNAVQFATFGNYKSTFEDNDIANNRIHYSYSDTTLSLVDFKSKYTSSLY